MAVIKNLLGVITLLYFCIINRASAESISWRSSTAFPTQCKDFKDERTKGFNNNEDRRSLIIPVYFTGRGQNDMTFYMQKASEDLKGYKDKALHECKNAHVEKINLTGEKYKFYLLWQITNGSVRFIDDTGKFHQNYFDVNGYYFDGKHYYDPDDYCVLSVSDEQIQLRICPSDCSAKLSFSHFTSRGNYYDSKICIPKCCGMDEVLTSPHFECRKLKNSESSYFIPYLQDVEPIDSTLNQKDPYSIAIHPYESQRAKFNETFDLEGDSMWNSLHFYKHKMSCKSQKYSLKMKFSNGFTEEPGYNQPYRLLISPGHVRPLYLQNNLKWAEWDDSNFCVDGLDQWEYKEDKKGRGKYEVVGPPGHQVVVVCDNADRQSAGGMVIKASPILGILILIMGLFGQ